MCSKTTAFLLRGKSICVRYVIQVTIKTMYFFVNICYYYYYIIAAMQRHILNGRLVSRPQTHLKYAVEVQIPRDPLRLLGLVEPIIERMVYEDLPLNLVR